MARTQGPAEDERTPEMQQVAAHIQASRGVVTGPFPVLLHQPRLARCVADLGAEIRFRTSLPPEVTALAALLVARDTDCDFEWAGWTVHARQAGVGDEVIRTIASGDVAALEGLVADGTVDGDLALVVRVGTQLLGTRRRVDEATYGAVVERFGVAGAVELTATFGYFSLLSFTLNAFEVDVPDGAEQLPPRR